MNVLDRNNIKLWDINKRKEKRKEHRYKEVHDVWIKNGFNKRHNIGYCIELLKQFQPTSLSDWENYYTKSGLDAKEKIENYYKKMKNKEISYNDFRDLKYNIKCNSGKSIQDLVDIAERFKDTLSQNGIVRSLEECFNYVYIKVIDESWLGYNREKQAIKALNDLCDKRDCYIKEADTILDIKYCVDYEIYNKNTDELVCGVQVKGYNFFMANQQEHKTEALQIAENIIKDAHKQYLNDFGKSATFLYIMNDGRCERNSYCQLRNMLPRQQLKKQMNIALSHRNYNNDRNCKRTEKIR